MVITRADIRDGDGDNNGSGEVAEGGSHDVGNGEMRVDCGYEVDGDETCKQEKNNRFITAHHTHKFTISFSTNRFNCRTEHSYCVSHKARLQLFEKVLCLHL